MVSNEGYESRDFSKDTSIYEFKGENVQVFLKDYQSKEFLGESMHGNVEKYICGKRLLGTVQTQVTVVKIPTLQMQTYLKRLKKLVQNCGSDADSQHISIERDVFI